ncbi:hypothetical protein ABN148_20915 [Klebsiella oxytoca]|uniref:hypothetical protein n=1 Tax=Klebsiella oxytoca TaxID=571 RepID=UPI0018A98A80|nr:hypothetical protein [Klebsiella oxytoca]
METLSLTKLNAIFAASKAQIQTVLTIAVRITLMTDVTELAQRVKTEASAIDDTQWYLAKPSEIRLLVEALGEAQGAATQQGNIACALLDEVTQLRRHADEKAPELRALLIEADSELEVLRQRIAELESFRTAYMEWSDKTDWVQGDKRFDVLIPWGKHRADVLKAYIERLESRTVTVKQFDEFQICHYGATEDYAKGYIDCQNNFFKWLTAAGIKWEAE